MDTTTDTSQADKQKHDDGAGGHDLGLAAFGPALGDRPDPPRHFSRSAPRLDQPDPRRRGDATGRQVGEEGRQPGHVVLAYENPKDVFSENRSALRRSLTR
jgi:hypothetical protein